jgi:hypothetical protein
VSPRLSPLPDRFAGTVASLHRVAEELVAPSRKPDNEIALEATSGGFGTPPFEFEGAVHQVRVEGTDLVHAEDGRERRAPLTSLASAASVVAELLPAGSSPDEAPLVIGAAAARVLSEWYAFGAEVLGRLGAAAAPEDEAGPAILWPEHFDIAIELGPEAAGARATFGFSPGDEEHPQPYAYVGPWTTQPPGEVWNARGFAGAELGYAELLVADDQAAAALDFLTGRRDALAATNPSKETT